MPGMLDGVLESTTTTGTADLDLNGAQAGFESFSSAGAVSGRQYYYYIADSASAPTLWERGVCTWTSGTPDTLSRDRVIRSSSGTTKISLLSGTTYLVACVDSVYAFQDGDFRWLTSVSGTDTITAAASPTLKAYAAGQTFRFKSAGANTGTSVNLNIDSVGAKNVTKRGATALAAGDLPSGAVVEVIYDGTQFQVTGLLGIPSGRTITAGSGLTGGGDLSADRTLVVGAGTGISVSADAVAIDKATTAQMEDPTSTGVNKVVTADNMQFHPGMAKAWVTFNGGTGAINGGAGVGSYNVSSVNRHAAGDYTINFPLPFASINYVAVATVVAPASNGTIWQAGLKNGSSPATDSFPLTTQPNNGAYSDAAWVSVVFFGGQ